MANIDELFSKESLDGLSKVLQTFQQLIPVLDQFVAKVSTIDKMMSAIGRAADSENQYNKAVKDTNDANKQYLLLSDEIIKAKLEFQKQAKEQRDRLKEEIAMQDAAADSVVAMKMRVNELIKEYNNLSGAARDKAAPAIKQLQEQIEKAQEATGRHTTGVGKYKEGIINAGKQLLSFGGIAAIAMTALNKLKEAFESTMGGMTLMSQAQQVSKQLFSDLISLEGINLQHLKEAADIGKQLAILHMDEYKINYDIKGVELERDELRLKASDQTRTLSDRLSLLTQVEQKEKEVVEGKLGPMREELLLINQQIDMRPKDIKLQEQGYELMGRMRDVQDEYAKSMKRIESQRTSDIKKEAEDRKKEHDDLMKLADEQIAEDEKKYKKEEEKKQEFEQKVDQQEKERVINNDEVLLEATNKLREEGERNYEKVLKEEEIAGNKSMTDILERVKEQNDKIEKENKKRVDEEVKIEKEKEKLVIDILRDADNLWKEIQDGKMQKLDKAEKDEIAAAGDNATLKAQIEDKYNKKKSELQKKAAVEEKATGLFSIAISTAMAVTKSLPNLVLAALSASLGAVQAAVVAAKPIPQYFKGTESSSYGPAIVGELGSELIVSPSGKVSLSGDSAEIRTLERGTKIIPSDETKRIINASRLSQRDTIEATIEKGNRDIVQAIKNKKEIILNTGVGSSIIERDGNTYRRYFERHLS